MIELLKNRGFQLMIHSFIMGIAFCHAPDQDGIVFGLILTSLAIAAGISTAKD